MLSSRPVQLPTDGALFPTRTPGRGLKSRAENAHAGMGVAMTVNGKGKNANVAPRTPFQPSSAQPQRLFKDQKTVLTTIGRPLIDKTPMPNRIGVVLFKTPLPGNKKPSKLRDEAGQEDNHSPGSAQRPSSMRKHIKHPRFSGKVLETPANGGGHWDISDGEIVLEAQSLQQETILEQEDDLDEIEYGPPNTLDIPFEPYFGFDLPDYTEVGRSLFRLAHSNHCNDITPPAELEISCSELENLNWDMISLPDIASDDPFFLARSEEKAKPVPVPAVPSYLLSKRIPVTGANASVNVKQRPQSSLTTASSSRPATRTGKVASTSTTLSTANTTQQKMKPKSNPTTKNPPSSKIKVSSTDLDRPLRGPAGKTSNLGFSSTHIGVSRQVAATTSTTATVARHVVSGATSNVARPRVAAVSSLRRPQTSLATATSSIKKPSRAPQAQKKGPVDADETDVLLIKGVGDTILDEELNFKFEI